VVDLGKHVVVVSQCAEMVCTQCRELQRYAATQSRSCSELGTDLSTWKARPLGTAAALRGRVRLRRG
jgi:hypothetical protein